MSRKESMDRVNAGEQRYVVGEFCNVMGVGEVVTEGVGIEGNGYGVNRSKYCSQRDRRETIRCWGGRAPSCFRSSRRRPSSIINNRRRKRRRGRNGGCIVRHGGGSSEREIEGGRQRDEAFYTK